MIIAGTIMGDITFYAITGQSLIIGNLLKLIL